MPFDPLAAEFEVLKTELEHANRYIGSYFDLMTKSVGIMLPLIGILGAWLLGTKDVGSQVHNPLVLVFASLILSGAQLNMAMMYGTALGYMRYKDVTLGARFKTLLAKEASPLESMASFREPRMREPVLLASGTMVLAVDLMTIVVLCAATIRAEAPSAAGGLYGLAVVAGWTVLVCALLSQMYLVRAWRLVVGKKG